MFFRSCFIIFTNISYININTYFRPHFLDCFNKAYIFIITYKCKNISRMPTWKTLKYLFFSRNTHTRICILMKWTNPKIIFSMRSKWQIFAYDFYYISLRSDVIYHFITYPWHFYLLLLIILVNTLISFIFFNKKALFFKKVLYFTQILHYYYYFMYLTA